MDRRLNPVFARLYRGIGDSPFRSPFLNSRELPIFGSEQQLQRVNESARLVGVERSAQTPTPDLDPTNAQVVNFENPVAFPIRDELKYGNFTNLTISAELASARVLLKPPTGTRRTFFAIFNTHATQTIFLAFGQDATAVNGIPIFAGGGIGLDAVVPQDDIYVIGSGAATVGVLVYSNDTIAAQR